MAESRQHNYQLTRPGESYCQPCLRNGHQCMTAGHNGDEYICAFCEDGVACPIAKASVKPSNGFRNTGVAPALTNGHSKSNGVANAHVNGNGDERRKGGRVPIGGIDTTPKQGPAGGDAVETKSKNEKERTMEKKPCSVDGCEKLIRASTKSGRCGKHFYIPKGGPHGKRGPRSNGVSLTPAPGKRKTAPAVATADGRVAIHLNESQVDNFFLSLTLSEKSQILNAHLAGGA